jgi:hypothetical protein
MKMSDNMYIGLTVTGPTGEISQFREAVRGRGENGDKIILDFNRVIPIPIEVTDPYAFDFIQIDNHQSKYSPSWIERNWGASSNALYTEMLEDSDSVFSVQFDTEGDFPYQVVEKIVTSFPQLFFEGSVFENVGKFYMTYTGRNGEFTCEEGNYTEVFGEEDEDEDDESYASEIWVASS